MIEDQELQRLFKAESEEHLALLDAGLLRLEKTPTDAKLLEEVFRESHSLKGAARMLGLARVEAAAHGLESLLNAARKGAAPLTPEALERMSVGLADLRRFVHEALDGEPPPEPDPVAVVPPTPDRIEPVAINEPGATPAVPPPPGPVATVLTSGPPAASASAPAVADAPFRIETVRVETRKLDDLLVQAGELAVIRGRAQHRRALMEELLEQWGVLERGRRKDDSGIAARYGKGSGVRQRFGSLLQQTRNALFDDSARLESTVNQLTDQVHGMRLLPLATVFGLFPRMLRDLAKAQGKEAELVIEGGDITVDKRILEEMKDPLMHLIRNAIDHGIEPPAERVRLGKPRAGTVRLSAWRENASVVLVVRDDGRGLDLEVIRQEAKKRGHHDDSALAAMTPAQLQQLVLLPGFSTSAYVTELSGRGVGLDVVRVNVERMKGSIHLDSAPGQGLEVQLRLPLSLATTRLLLANVAGRSYGLPVECIQTCLRVHEQDILTLEGRPVILLDGQPVVAVRLADLLELPGTHGAEMSDTPVCIVLQVGEERLGVLADALLAEEEVVPKPLGPPLRRVRNVSALAMLGSGEICALLNPGDLLRSAHKASFDVRAEQGGLPREAARPAILLAEDSALIRAMEKRVLEDGGYEVVTAVDGADALNLLGSRPFAAVVSDIMMPNMSGLVLTERIRAESRYRELPVILVTSLASDEDKRRGLEVGANAYIPKPAFDQRMLLDALKRLIVP